MKKFEENSNIKLFLLANNVCRRTALTCSVRVQHTTECKQLQRVKLRNLAPSCKRCEKYKPQRKELQKKIMDLDKIHSKIPKI